MKQGTLLTALAAAAALATAAGAAASDPSVTIGTGGTGHGAHASGLQLGITGSPAADRISVTLDGTQSQFVITSARPIDPPPSPCVQISTSEVHCPISSFVSFSAALGKGSDAFTVGPSVVVPVTMTGGDGRDKLIGGSGSDTILGGVGRDRLTGRNGRDSLNGGKGRDTESGGKGRDTLLGGKSHDLLKGGRRARPAQGRSRARHAARRRRTRRREAVAAAARLASVRASAPRQRHRSGASPPGAAIRTLACSVSTASGHCRPSSEVIRPPRP